MSSEPGNSKVRSANRRGGEARWQLQNAKNRLSEVVRRARAGEAQVITVRGEDVAVVVSIDDYRRARPVREGDKSLLDILQSSPLRLEMSDEEIDQLFARDSDTGRDFEFE